VPAAPAAAGAHRQESFGNGEFDPAPRAASVMSMSQLSFLLLRCI
jgi:hypothetical protein